MQIPSAPAWKTRTSQFPGYPELFRDIPRPDPRWVLVEEGFNLAREHEIESLFSIANGYIGSRASLAEGSALSSPATFIAGIYNVDPYGSAPELAAAPDWMHIRATINGSRVSIETSNPVDHRRILDMSHGILWRDWLFEDEAGRRTRISGLRLVSLTDRHLLLQSMHFTPLNYNGPVSLETGVSPPGMRPGQRTLEVEPGSFRSALSSGHGVAMELVSQQGQRVAFASLARVQGADGRNLPSASRRLAEGVERWEADVTMGHTYRVDRLVTVYTTRDCERPLHAAVEHLERLQGIAPGLLVQRHTAAWQARWRDTDIRIEGDEDAQRALRFACYHLISAANPDDDGVSVGARALTGPAYHGHVFWDTETFMLPFYIFTHPPSARSLLMYRYRCLDAARENAREKGYRGALFAWESAETGEETTPRFAVTPAGEVIPILSGDQEHHISADIAYGVWQYWQASGDTGFFLQAGAEIMLETARFWASRATPGADGLYHVRKVVGPDEYHEGVDDNAYTNMLAQWNLEQGLKTQRWLARHHPDTWARMSERLDLADRELQHWQEVEALMYTGFQPQSHIFEQFRGFFRLSDIDLGTLPATGAPPDVVLGRARTKASKISKQADVVMLLFMLWDLLSPEARRANFHYYEPRTAHGSSLSPSIHALVAARLGELDTAVRYFRQGAEIDLSNNMGNAARGVHAAALGGLWQSVVCGFAGMRMTQGHLRFDPHLPRHWNTLRFPLHWRGQRLHVLIKHGQSEVTVSGEAAVSIAFGDGEAVRIKPGGLCQWSRNASGQWREQLP